MPFHGVRSRLQRLELDVHFLFIAGIDRRRSVVHGGSGFIGNLYPTKRRLELLGEPYVQNLRRFWDGAADGRVGMIEERVRPNRYGRAKHRDDERGYSDDTNSHYCHRFFLMMGLPNQLL